MKGFSGRTRKILYYRMLKEPSVKLINGAQAEIRCGSENILQSFDEPS